MSNLTDLSLFLEFLIYHRYESAEECADDDDDKLGLSQLRKEILEELKMHDSLVKVRHFPGNTNLNWARVFHLVYYNSTTNKI